MEKESIVDLLRRRGLRFEDISDIFIMRGVAKELANNFFIHCEIASLFGTNSFVNSGLDWCGPRSLKELVELWRWDPWLG